MISCRPASTTASMLLLFFALAHPVFGQVSSASLSGVVTDESKAVLPGATISATEQASGRQYMAAADERGEYREVFNVFNHANYGTYNGIVDSPTFGQPLQVSAFSGSGTAYVPRTAQLAFRVTF